MKISLVTTGVRQTNSLLEFAGRLEAEESDKVELIVVGQRTSPKSLQAVCAEISQKYLPCTFLDHDRQRALLALRSPELQKHLRYESRQRLNLGFLESYMNGAEYLISFDSADRVPASGFINSHLRALESSSGPSISSSNNWLNQAVLLEASSSARPFAYRGFPSGIPPNPGIETLPEASIPVIANCGLCYDPPDLNAEMRQKGESSSASPDPKFHPSIRLSTGTWAPLAVNNFAIRREALPAYFLSPYVGRFDDIWAGYILTRIAQHLGHTVAIGVPYANRNVDAQDLKLDCELELVGNRQTLRFCEALRAIPLSASSYLDCLGEIALALPKLWTEGRSPSGIEIEARSQLLNGLSLWYALFTSLHASGVAKLFQSLNQESPNTLARNVVVRTP